MLKYRLGSVILANRVIKNTYKVKRKCDPNKDMSWYEVMLSPFNSFEECIEYIEQYRHYYPPEHQNYKITYET
jgi:hypothetical protein